MSAVNSACGGFEDAVVLDAFAGSGALGLEALSRGASCARFFERDGAAVRVLEMCIRDRRYTSSIACVRPRGFAPALRKEEP